MAEHILMTERDIDRSLDRISLEIVERNHGIEQLALVGIHTGGAFLAQRIHNRIVEHEQVALPTGSLDITLYRDDWSLVSQNPIVKKSAIDFPLEDCNVVLVDDVIFTGRTIRAAMDAIMDYGRPKSIQLAVLVDRGGRELPVQPDFVGTRINVADQERVDVLLMENSQCNQVILSLR
ncbi:MAG: bifunctional pyr operon transcriptional regulator/uracil phosphoribosyltransferase [Desulfobulbus propionicus]|nr:MAG: bifunctional pyr operon transcriptional regulator/uracil phosphoribosyltransferase [Desulfobulbus propionicus]PIE66587.1 MAG: bifunctional pyr operon transcriptional regulator/uracil phosphoribosyltransferase [Desulfobacterales bacterium]